MTSAKILLIPAKPVLRIKYGGEFPSGLRPSTAVRDGCRFASLTPSYLSLGFRFAASRTAGAHLCPSGAVQDGCHFTSFIPACPSPGFRLAAFPYGAQSLPLPVADAGRRQRSEQGSITSAPVRCEETIANLTAAKQEGGRLRWMRLRPLGVLGSALQSPSLDRASGWHFLRFA